jgi:voltage-gated potassium channel Kch
MAVARECNESPVYQGANESLKYTLTTTPWGSTPTTVVLALTDITVSESPVDVTSTLLSGSSSVAGNVITTKVVSGLTSQKKYRLDIKFTDSASNIFEAFVIIQCR